MKEKIAEDMSIEISTYMEQQYMNIQISMDFDVVCGDTMASFVKGIGFDLIDVPEELIGKRIEHAIRDVLYSATRNIHEILVSQVEEEEE